MKKLLEISNEVQCHFALSSYEVHLLDDGSYCDLKVRRVTNPRELNKLVGDLEYYILCTDESLIIRIFEDDIEY